MSKNIGVQFRPPPILMYRQFSDGPKKASIWSKRQTQEFQPSGVSGAARGQGGGGARAGSGRGIFEQYSQLTPEQKRKAAKERRLAKKGIKKTMDGAIFLELVEKSLDKYETAFLNLQQQNDKGHITVTRQEMELLIDVKHVGPYRFFVDVQEQLFQLHSGDSGLYQYKWDDTENFWKSTSQVHILEELLVREFIMHSKGLLDI